MTAKQPDIVIVKASCSQFEGGVCYHAENPYYTGHYDTKERVALAATEKKKQMAREARIDDTRYSRTNRRKHE